MQNRLILHHIDNIKWILLPVNNDSDIFIYMLSYTWLRQHITSVMLLSKVSSHIQNNCLKKISTYNFHINHKKKVQTVL